MHFFELLSDTQWLTLMATAEDRLAPFHKSTCKATTQGEEPDPLKIASLAALQRQFWLTLRTCGIKYDKKFR